MSLLWLVLTLSAPGQPDIVLNLERVPALECQTQGYMIGVQYVVAHPEYQGMRLQTQCSKRKQGAA